MRLRCHAVPRTLQAAASFASIRNARHSANPSADECGSARAAPARIPTYFSCNIIRPANQYKIRQISRPESMRSLTLGAGGGGR